MKPCTLCPMTIKPQPGEQCYPNCWLKSWAERHVELLTTRKQLSEASARNAMLVDLLETIQACYGLTGEKLKKELLK